MSADLAAPSFLPRVNGGSDAATPNGPSAGGATPDRGWLPQDVGAWLDGETKTVLPELLPREDGKCLLYRGLVHSLHGESESGKSLVAQAEAARILLDGGSVAYVDFESDLASVGGRLLAMGVPRDVLKARFLYLRPEASYEDTDEAKAAFEQLASQQLDFIVVDGVTDSLLVFGLAGRDEADFTRWFRLLPRSLAERTGAAVVNVDHVTKDAESRGRHAIGSQAKMNTLTGAAYVVTVKEALGQGMRGSVELRVVKDRPGQVRPHCGPFRSSDRSQAAATIVFDSTDGETIKVTVKALDGLISAEGDSAPAKPFRPTGFMERISRALELASQPLSGREVEALVSGNAAHKRTALALLVAEGHVAKAKDGNGFAHRSVRPYRQTQDPQSDMYREVVELPYERDAA